MKNRPWVDVVSLVAGLLLLAIAFAAAQGGTPELAPGSKAVIQPAELATLMQSGKAPTVFYVGPRYLYSHGHIPGAEFIGPASEAASLDALRRRAANLPRSSAIVVYCGCCPWDHCPNIRPAGRELQRMKFTNVKVLYVATNFGTDWADKGYPTEKGE
jgi:thiosulfate/3-mercaptopyruvate sulfurtransferase